MHIHERPAEGKDIDCEDRLWKAADKLRKKVVFREYKYVVLGLMFLKYLPFAFDERGKELEQAFSDSASEEYIAYENFRKQALDARVTNEKQMSGKN